MFNGLALEEVPEYDHTEVGPETPDEDALAYDLDAGSYTKFDMANLTVSDGGSSPLNGSFNAWKTTFVHVNCAESGIELWPAGKSAGLAVYKFLPGVSLTDLSTEELADHAATDPWQDPTWTVTTNPVEDQTQVTEAGTVIFKQSWLDLNWPGIPDEIDRASSSVLAIELVPDEGAAAGTCAGEFYARTLLHAFYDEADYNVRWAGGGTNYHHSECTGDELYGQIDCWDPSLYPTNEGSCNVNDSPCNNPNITECIVNDEATGEGTCSLTLEFTQSRFSTFGVAVPWPQASMLNSHNHTTSLFDCTTEEFFEVRILKWTSMGKGGGFELAYAPTDAPDWYSPGAIHCPLFFGDEYEDSDNDGVYDAGDAFAPADNCPSDSNPDQADSDEDGIGDACQVVE